MIGEAGKDEEREIFLFGARKEFFSFFDGNPMPLGVSTRLASLARLRMDTLVRRKTCLRWDMADMCDVNIVVKPLEEIFCVKVLQVFLVNSKDANLSADGEGRILPILREADTDGARIRLCERCKAEMDLDKDLGEKESVRDTGFWKEIDFLIACNH